MNLSKEQLERLSRALKLLYIDGIDLYRRDCEKLYFSIPEQSYMYNPYSGMSNSNDCVQYIEQMLLVRFELRGFKIRYKTRREHWTMEKRSKRMEEQHGNIDYDFYISKINNGHTEYLNNKEEKAVSGIVNLFKLLKLEGVEIINMLPSNDNSNLTVYLEIPKKSVLYEEKSHSGIVDAPSFANYIENQLHKISKGEYTVKVIYKAVDIYWTKEMRDNKNREILNKSRVYKY